MFLNKKTSLTQVFIQSLLSIFLVASMLWSYTLTMGYYFVYIEILAFSAICFILISGCLFNKKTLWITLGMLILGGVVGIPLIFYFRQFEFVQDKTIEYYYQIYTSLKGVDFVSLEVQMIIISIVGLILTLAVYIIWNKKNHYPILLFFSLLYYFGMWQIQPFGIKGSFNLLVYCFLIVLVYFHHYLRVAEKDILSQYPVRFFITAFTLSLSLTLLVRGLHNYIPNPFEMFKETVRSGGISEHTGTIDFNIESEYIYLSLNESDVNSIPNFTGQDIAVARGRQKIYLRGAVFDAFDGRYWSNSLNEPIEVIQDQGMIHYKDLLLSNSFEHIYGISLMEEEPLTLGPEITWAELHTPFFNKYFYIDDIRVTNKKFLSYSMLAPINFIDVRFQEDVVFKNTHLTKEEILVTNQFLIENFVATFSTIVPNYNLPELQDLLRKSERGFYKKYSNDFAEALSLKAEEIYSIYTQMPTYVNPKVIQLADSLTKDLDNNFDKVKAIEEYLKNNHTYTYTPALNPDESDHVGNFLFEIQEGFCTSFATSMAVMVRSLGIPVRYVSGFVASDTFEMNQNRISDQQNIYIVKDKNAHAWVEVYFEGFGWVPFEPTSGFDYQEQVITQNEIIDKNATMRFRLNLQIDDTIKMSVALIIFIFVGVLLPIRIRFKRRRSFKKKDTKGKYMTYYKFSFILLKHIGFLKSKDETMSQYVQHYKDAILMESYSLEEMTQIYEDIYYGNYSISEEELNRMEVFYKELRSKAWKYGNKFRYVWMLYTSKIL